MYSQIYKLNHLGPVWQCILVFGRILEPESHLAKLASDMNDAETHIALAHPHAHGGRQILISHDDDFDAHEGCHFIYDIVPWYMFANFVLVIILSAIYVCVRGLRRN